MARGLQAVQAQQKSNAKALAKKKQDAKKAGGAATGSAKSELCSVCRAEVRQLGKTTETALVKLNEHIATKHSGKNGRTLAECFPKYTPSALSAASAVSAAAAPKYKEDKPLAVRKVRTHKRG
jgi:hypothetical protein